MLRKAGFLLLLLPLIFSCSDVVQDNEDPVLSRADLNAKTFEPSEILTVIAAGTDNENLGQVRIRIEDAFDKSAFGFWYILNITDISGSSFESSFSFQVPDSALAGYYEIAVQFSDLRGNASVDSLQYFTITQDGIAPQIKNFATNPEPDPSNTIFLQGGDTLSFSGIAMSDTTLNQIEIELLSDQGFTIDNFNYNLDDSTSMWDFELYADSIFADFTSNPENLIIRVFDTQGHLTRTDFEVEYSP